MPNYVTNKIIFVADEGKANEIFAAIEGKNGAFDFNTLIQTPLNVYQGSVGIVEEKDFPDNWYSWNTKNWGTKWNVCNQAKKSYQDGFGSIVFDTAWSVPRPIIVAFANKFNLKFTLKYFDEGECFWGVEEWNAGCRQEKRFMLDEDKTALRIELIGDDEEDD